MMTFSAIAFDTPFYNTGLPVVLAGTAAILGHTFTPWLGFKGGKGVATTFGVFVLLVPITTLVCVTVFALIVLSTKYVSLGSIAGAVILPVGVFFEKVPFAEYSNAKVLFLLSLALAAFIIIKHRANITRLLQGNENKFGQTSH
jgi:glycerol-3-phosphate acyltransferase PlsY